MTTLQPLRSPDVPIAAFPQRSNAAAVAAVLFAAALVLRTAALALDALFAAAFALASLLMSSSLFAPGKTLVALGAMASRPAGDLSLTVSLIYASGAALVVLFYGVPMMLGISPAEITTGPLHARAREVWARALGARRDRDIRPVAIHFRQGMMQ